MLRQGKATKAPFIINVNGFLVSFVFAAVLSLLALAGVGVYKTYSLINTEITYRRVAEENRYLVSTLDGFKQKIGNKTEIVEEISRLETMLSIHYGISPIADEIKRMSVGGRATLNDRATMMLGSPLEKSIADTKEEVMSNRRRFDFLTTRLANIREEAERQNSYFAEKPSIWPVTGRITSEFGNRFHPVLDGFLHHQGIDIANAMWMPIRATADGIVTFSGTRGGFGIVVEIEHRRSGYTTRYAHLAEANVRVGTRVKRGDIIGALGNTGMSTGPHLHYEVRRGNRALNPRLYFISERTMSAIQ